MIFSRRSVATLVATMLSTRATAQTSTSCNPLTTTCNPDTALGMTINVDFTQGGVNSFTTAGSPTYGSNGAQFSVAKTGDSPMLTSVFYIMFGRVEITLKAAPGNGIVSSVVLQSDDLDEIDFEWLGYDGANVQTNYFGKGITGSYDRGTINAIANNQNQYITYVIDWTQDRIIWSAGGTVLRTLTAAGAEANQYPQTPMQLKIGTWSGGDSSNNSPGTVTWAHGPTDYSKGPFSMFVKTLKVTDYSTGKQYKYGDMSGSWSSIQAIGGTVNGNAGGAGGLTTTGVATAGSSSTDVPGGIGSSSTGTSSSSSTTNIPEGWTMTSSGKLVPSSSAVSPPASSLSTPSSSPSPPPSSSAAPPTTTTTTTPLTTPATTPTAPVETGVTVITTWDGRGLPTVITVPQGFTTMVKSYDAQGFPVFPTAAASVPTEAPALAAATSSRVVDTSVKVAGGARAAPRLLLPAWWAAALSVLGAALLL